MSKGAPLRSLGKMSYKPKFKMAASQLPVHYKIT